MGQNEASTWIPCPICGQKTRTKIFRKSVMIDFPLYCQRCKQETIINVFQFKISLSNEPDV